MAQYGLPISDKSSSNVSEGAGDADGDIFDELDEGFGAGRGSGSGPDDATTFWESTGFIVQIQCNINSLTDPAASTGHIIRSRVRKSASAGKQIDDEIELWQGTTLIAEHTLADISDTWTTHTYTLTAEEADAITDYTALGIQNIGREVAGGAPRDWHLSAQELEVPDAEAATPLTLEVADDANNLADSFTKALAINLIQSAGDSLDNLGDALLKNFEYRKIISDDSLNLADTLNKIFSYRLIKSDNALNLLDNLRNVYGLNFPFGDDLNNWLDSLAKELLEPDNDLALNLSDTINNLVDNLLLNLSYRKLLADNMLGLADSEIVNLGYSIPNGDSINNLGDDFFLRYGYKLIKGDNLGDLLDSLNIRRSLELLKGDSISNWLDSITKIYGYHILSVDILTQSDSLNNRLGYLISDSDNMGDLLDTLTIQRLHQFLISHGDSFTLLDSLDSISLTEPGDDEQQIVIRLLI